MMNEFQFTIDFIRQPKMSRPEMGLDLANAAESEVEVRHAIDALAARKPISSEVSRLVECCEPSQRSRVAKFQRCLPPEIEYGLNGRETMIVDDANKSLVALKPNGAEELQ